MKRGVYAVAATVAAGLLLGVPAQAAPSDRLAASIPRTLDPATPVRMNPTMCADETDLDCIEALGVASRDGFVPGEIISTSPLRTIRPVETDASET